MCTPDNIDFCANAPDERSTAAPPPAAPPTEAVAPRAPWARRALLKAAALGTVGAALAGRAGPAAAHTDARSACTANDIEVTGGTIINEPCECTGEDFDAVAVFQVTNNNNATRKCIALHLGAGGTLGGKDFYLNTKEDGSGSSNISGNGTTQTMYADLGKLPCDFGRECYAGSVIAFQTAQNQSDAACPGQPATRYPGGQCRRQDICITGFSADLACATEDCATIPNGACSVSCGGTLYLKATATGGTDGADGTYTFRLAGPGGFTASKSGSSPQCFAVTTPATGTYTLTVTDSKRCPRTASTTVTVDGITAALTGQTTPGCSTGRVTFGASASGSNCTFAFKVDGAAQATTAGATTFTYDPVALGKLDGGCHTVRVDATCGGCSASDTKTVQSCVSSTVGGCTVAGAGVARSRQEGKAGRQLGGKERQRNQPNRR